MAVTNGTGQGGKSFQDRQLAAEVRSSALKSIKAILNNEPEVEEWSDYKKQLLLKMSSSILPRLNEHTGADGEALKITFDGAFTRSSKEDSSE